jgi:dihydroneopterin aldolase
MITRTLNRSRNISSNEKLLLYGHLITPAILLILNAMDIVYLSDLRIDTVIGIYDWERRIKQTVSLNLEMATDVAKAAASDNIKDACDYKAVAKRLIEFVGNSEFLLVETLAERIAQIVLNEFGIPWLRLKVDKQGAVRGAQGVGVIIERSRPELSHL